MNNTETAKEVTKIVFSITWVIAIKDCIFYTPGVPTKFVEEVAIRAATTITRDVVAPAVEEHFGYKLADYIGGGYVFPVLSCMRAAAIYTTLKGTGPYGALTFLGCLNGVGYALYPADYPAAPFFVELAEGVVSGAFTGNMAESAQAGAKAGAALTALIEVYGKVIAPMVDDAFNYLVGSDSIAHDEL